MSLFTIITCVESRTFFFFEHPSSHLYPQHSLVAVLSSLLALPARKHFFRHRTDNSGPMTGSRLMAPVMGPEVGKVGARGIFGSMGSALHSPTLASGPAPTISHSSETDGH